MLTSMSMESSGKSWQLLPSTEETARALWPRILKQPEIFDDDSFSYAAFHKRVLESVVYAVPEGIVAFTDTRPGIESWFHICMFDGARADYPLVREIIADLVARFELVQVMSFVPVDNPRAVRFVEKLGFVPSCRVPRVFKRNTQLLDVIVFRMEV